MEVQTSQTLEKTHTHTVTNTEDRVDCVRYLSLSTCYFHYYYYYNFLSCHLPGTFRPDTRQEIMEMIFIFTPEFKNRQQSLLLENQVFFIQSL